MRQGEDSHSLISRQLGGEPRRQFVLKDLDLFISNTQTVLCRFALLSLGITCTMSSVLGREDYSITCQQCIMMITTNIVQCNNFNIQILYHLLRGTDKSTVCYDVI